VPFSPRQCRLAQDAGRPHGAVRPDRRAGPVGAVLLKTVPFSPRQCRLAQDSAAKVALLNSEKCFIFTRYSTFWMAAPD